MLSITESKQICNCKPAKIQYNKVYNITKILDMLIP